MAAGDLTLVYTASETLTQTNLDGLAASATHVAGWGSGAIDNTTAKNADHKLTVVVQVESTSVTAGEIIVWLIEQLNDSAWPAVLSSGTMGTEGAITFTDTEQRDAVARFAGKAVNDTGASEFYTIPVPSVAAVFDYNMPARYVVIVTQNTGTTLETTGDPNQVYLKRSSFNVAQS